jgi:hypothetical protein
MTLGSVGTTRSVIASPPIGGGGVGRQARDTVQGRWNGWWASVTGRAWPAIVKDPEPIRKREFAFFDFVHKDGSQRCRRVPAKLLGGLDGDELARGYIMEQDREIAEKSGRPPLEIKSINRVGSKKK